MKHVYFLILSVLFVGCSAQTGQLPPVSAAQLDSGTDWNSGKAPFLSGCQQDLQAGDAVTNYGLQSNGEVFCLCVFDHLSGADSGQPLVTYQAFQANPSQTIQSIDPTAFSDCDQQGVYTAEELLTTYLYPATH